MGNVAGSSGGGGLTVNVTGLGDVAPAIQRARSILNSARNKLSSIKIPSDFSGGGTIKSACSTISSIEGRLSTAGSNVTTVINNYVSTIAKNDEIINDLFKIGASATESMLRKSKTDTKTPTIFGIKASVPGKEYTATQKLYLNGSLSTMAGGNTGSAKESLKTVQQIVSRLGFRASVPNRTNKVDINIVRQFKWNRKSKYIPKNRSKNDKKTRYTKIILKWIIINNGRKKYRNRQGISRRSKKNMGKHTKWSNRTCTWSRRNRRKCR